MGMCMKLKFNRRRLKMSQQEFAKLVGLSQSTIHKLETDETAWATLKSETVDKIYSHFDTMASWQPERADRVIRELNSDSIESEVEEKTEPELPVVCEAVVMEKEQGLTKQDEKAMTLLEFIHDGLKDCTKHEEFMVHINMIKRIVNQY